MDNGSFMDVYLLSIQGINVTITLIPGQTTPLHGQLTWSIVHKRLNIHSASSSQTTVIVQVNRPGSFLHRLSITYYIDKILADDWIV